jgi:aryl-alcohol dehydrogenase-like predicted oxidoreductase
LKKAGKIRAIGVSNFSSAQMDAFRSVAPLHTAQPPYNLFERAIERDVLPYCRDKNMVTLAYGSLCRGLLSGSMTRQTQFSGDDLRKHDPKFQAPRFAQYLEAVEKLDRFAQENYGKRVIHLAVRWILDRQESSIALWAPAARISLLQSATWRVGASSLPPWPKSIASFPTRSSIRWALNSWHRPINSPHKDRSAHVLRKPVFPTAIQAAMLRL